MYMHVYTVCTYMYMYIADISINLPAMCTLSQYVQVPRDKESSDAGHGSPQPVSMSKQLCLTQVSSKCIIYKYSLSIVCVHVHSK